MVHPIHLFSSHLSLVFGVSGVYQTVLSPVLGLVCAVDVQQKDGKQRQ